jgi:hypothetical protein
MTTPRSDRNDRSVTVANVLRLLIGLWVLEAPLFYVPFGATYAAIWNQFVVGGAVVVLGAMRMVFVNETPAFRIAHLLLGVWIAASPWIFNYLTQDAAFWNSLISGTVIAVLATWSVVR